MRGIWANTQNRIKVALAVFALLVMGVVFLFKVWNDRQDRSLVYQYNLARSSLCTSTLESRKSWLENSVRALSFSEEIGRVARRISSPRSTDDLRRSLGYTGVWVFDTEQRLVADSSDRRHWTQKTPRPKPSLDAKAPNKVRITFAMTPKGVQMLAAARIPGENKGKYVGYVVAATLLDKPFLTNLAETTDTIVRISTSKTDSRDLYADIGLFTKKIPLEAANGKPVAWLQFTTNSREIAALRERGAVTLLFTCLCLCWLIVGLSAFLRQFVAVPKKELSQAMKSGDTSALAKHVGDDVEMKEILTLVETHAKNNNLVSVNAALEKIVNRRTQELERSYGELLEALIAALELRDQETEGHSRRVTEMTVTLAQRMGFSGDDLVHVRRGALLHDIGKIGVPDAILLKSGPLTPEERVVISKHPEFAGNILKNIEFIGPAMDIPLCHHEKWDGTGYPKGLKGEEIPLSARIFSVVDVWDALSSNRPYRKAWNVEQVRAELQRMSGTHFDPRVVAIMVSVLDEQISKLPRAA